MESSCSTNQMYDLRAAATVPPFYQKLQAAGLFPLMSTGLSTLQVNVGRTCNMSCKHCHMDAGPDRTESMSRETISQCLGVLRGTNISTLDITGGAPELNPYLPWFIEEAVKLGRQVIVRTNLTVLDADNYACFAEFYAAHQVELIASLPYYREKNTDRQRGEGVFSASVRVLKRLNKLGYGLEQDKLRLNLVYNPGGAFLPPVQHALEADFRRELMRRHGVAFNRLFTITNVPAGRFLGFLQNSGNLEKYLERLSDAFNPAAAAGVMCRNQISAGWDGRLYDCDFNQALGLPCAPEVPGHIQDFDWASLKKRPIMLGDHCYACTAGFGSSCGGAVVKG